MSKNAEAERDYFYLTEIMNDLHENGLHGGKAMDMMREWKAELQMKAGVKKSDQRKRHDTLCGAENW